MDEEAEIQSAVFEHGVVPLRDLREREIVLTEVDGTFLRAQREESVKFVVRPGVLTTGKILGQSDGQAPPISTGRACPLWQCENDTGLRRALVPQR